ncbi:MAG: hypothetical protein RL248_1800 [Pseudomonadota bacterium]
MLSRENHLMIKQMQGQGAYLVDIAHYLGCSEKTVRRHFRFPEPHTRGKRFALKLNPVTSFNMTGGNRG